MPRETERGARACRTRALGAFLAPAFPSRTGQLRWDREPAERHAPYLPGLQKKTDPKTLGKESSCGSSLFSWRKPPSVATRDVVLPLTLWLGAEAVRVLPADAVRSGSRWSRNRRRVRACSSLRGVRPAASAADVPARTSRARGGDASKGRRSRRGRTCAWEDAARHPTERGARLHRPRTHRLFSAKSTPLLPPPPSTPPFLHG